MDTSFSSCALALPSTEKPPHVLPKRKPLASKDPNQLPVVHCSSSIFRGRAIVNREDKPPKGSSGEMVPLVKAKTRDQLVADYRAQQSQLTLLQLELDEYKAHNAKTLEEHLFDRFEGVGKNDVMTQFSCKWFGILLITHAMFYYFYFVLRKGSQAFVDDDAVSSAKTVVLEGIFQVSCYSMLYVFIALFDIFWCVIIPDRVRCERNTARSHVIVAAHRAADSLAVMLPTVLATFSPECVWVADNGFEDKAAKALCERLGVHYEFNAIGNKANALVVVARKIKRLYGESVQNVVLLDDDTELADDFFIRHDLLAKPRVGGYCVGIAVNREQPMNIWEIAIDFEYRAISHAFAARATCSTLPFCHGICAVYKLDLMIEMYSKNWSLPGGLPFGEDGYSGLDYRLAGYRLLQDNANVVLTFCPRRFFPPIFSTGRQQGYGASCLWKQRACRWFLSWPRQLPAEFWLMFTYDAGTWYGNIQYRVYFFWWLFLNCISVAWVPYMIYVWVKHESWILVLLLKGMLTVTGILVSALRILAFPPNLRRGIHPLAPLCSPILGYANSILRFFGFLMALYWFIPFYRVNKLRVLGGEQEDDVCSIERGLSHRYLANFSETEELTETENYYDVELEDHDVTHPVIRKSWMQLLSDNLARCVSSDDEGELPSLKSYSSSSLSTDTPSSTGFTSSRIEL